MTREIKYYKINDKMPNTGKARIIGVYTDGLEDYKFFNPKIILGEIASEDEYLKQERDFKNSNYAKRYCMCYTSREDWEKKYPNDSWDEIGSKSEDEYCFILNKS